jgi:hypothetical protein
MKYKNSTRGRSSTTIQTVASKSRPPVPPPVQLPTAIIHIGLHHMVLARKERQDAAADYNATREFCPDCHAPIPHGGECGQCTLQFA